MWFCNQEKIKGCKIFAWEFHQSTTTIQSPPILKNKHNKTKKPNHCDLAAIQMFEKMHLQPNYNLIISDYRYLYNPIYLLVKYQKNTVFLAFIKILLCYKTYWQSKLMIQKASQLPWKLWADFKTSNFSSCSLSFAVPKPNKTVFL